MTAPGREPGPIVLLAGEDAAGERLDRFVAAAAGSRAAAQRLIESGAVTVDGAPRAKNHVLRAGETVTVAVPDPAVDAAAGAGAGAGEGVPFRTVYEDDALIVVDKPAGVVVHPARGHATGTLAQALGGVGGEDASRPGIVHRLDRDTSGLLVVARSEEAHRRLKALLAERQMRREYLALVAGRPGSRAGTIDAPIGRHPTDRLAMAVHAPGAPEGRVARTHFTTERALPRATLLRVRLETGRTHQIRVHLQAIGLPVCGDPQYGVAGAYGLTRQFLHAARLAFPHPLTGEELDLRSPLPDDLAAALAAAERG